MDYIKINIDRFGHYALCEIQSEDLGILGSFLASAVRCSDTSAKNFKELALDNTILGGGGNATALDKEDGYIYIRYEFDLNGPFCKIPLDEFVKILDQWEEFCKTKPKEILITRENGEIKMEGIW